MATRVLTATWHKLYPTCDDPSYGHTGTAFSPREERTYNCNSWRRRIFPEASPSKIFSLYSWRQCSEGEVRVWYEGNNRNRRHTTYCYCSLWKSHRNKRCVQEELPKGERVLYVEKDQTWHFPASTDKRYREILSRIEKHLLQSTCSSTWPDNLDSRQFSLVLRSDIFYRFSVHTIGPIFKGQVLEIINLRCVRT